MGEKRHWGRVLGIVLLGLCMAHMADTTGLVEGDMAIPRRADGGSGVQESFLSNKSNLWEDGRVPYKFEMMELEGGDFEEVFRDEDMNMVRNVLQEITDAVPCIEFK